jgi:hypothetical protein
MEQKRRRRCRSMLAAYGGGGRASDATRRRVLWYVEVSLCWSFEESEGPSKDQACKLAAR